MTYKRRLKPLKSPEDLEHIILAKDRSAVYRAMSHIAFDYKSLYNYLNERILTTGTGSRDKTKAEILGDMMKVSPTTIYRWKSSTQVVGEKYVDRLSAIIELFLYGEEVFGSDDHFKSWLESANIHLEGQVPLQLFDSLAGINLVKHLLDKIEYGAPV